MRATRDEARVAAALAALSSAAQGFSDSQAVASASASGTGVSASAGAGSRQNLLGLAVEAAHARASLGEISSALENVWGRYVFILPPWCTDHDERSYVLYMYCVCT